MLYNEKRNNIVGERSSVPFFGVGVLLILLGIPTVADIGLAMYSKVLITVYTVSHKKVFLALWGSSNTLFALKLLTFKPIRGIYVHWYSYYYLY